MITKTFIAMVLVIAMIAGCSSVRKGNTKRTSRPSSEHITSSKMNNNETKEHNSQIILEPKQRFGDTTFIYLSKADGKSSNSLANYTKAVHIYDKGNFEKSCEMFFKLKEQLTESDDIYYDMIFYCSECLIIEEDLLSAESLLKELLVNPKTPNTVHQKVLVRLGQVYCVLGNHKMANLLFKRLRAEFPNSKYIPLANCESVSE